MFIKVLDVNDNAPEFAMSYDTFVCENVKAGQVLRFMILHEAKAVGCVWIVIILVQFKYQEIFVLQL